MHKKQSGYSLGELVIVIVIVGLLSVIALPRFMDITDSAKQASIEGVAGGFATGVLSARAQWEGVGRPSVTINTANNAEKYNTVDYDGVEFWLTRSRDSSGSDTGFRDGYPFALNVNNASYPTALTDQVCIDLMNNLLQNPPSADTVTAANGNPNIRYSAQADNNTATCTYFQEEAGNADHKFVYDIKTGRVTVTLQ